MKYFFSFSPSIGVELDRGKKFCQLVGLAAEKSDRRPLTSSLLAAEHPFFPNAGVKRQVVRNESCQRPILLKGSDLLAAQRFTKNFA